MNGCVALRKDTYYVRLTYYDKNHCRKEKWISTGLSGRGAKQKATAMIDSMIEKYSYLEKSDHPTKMADYLQMWKELRKSEVAETTYDGYHTYIDRHLMPYFKELNLNIQDITAGHIFDYINYLSNDGGRKDNKVGGQSNTSIRKIISILRQVFEYAVLYGDIRVNPAKQIPLPKSKSKKDERQVFLTAEDAQKMLDAFRNEEVGPIVFVTLYYGLRKSEALGLRWQAVDFEANTMTINHTVVSNGHIIAKDSTKTYSSRRTFELLPDVRDLLVKLKEQQEDYKRRLGSGYHMFFYRMNHQQGNMIAVEKFEEFLGAFESNPFKINENKAFRKQLIDNIIMYAHDHMSLLTAAVLIKKKFTIDEISQNYYSSIDVFDGNWY